MRYEKNYAKLSAHPQHYSFINKRYRRLKVNCFPDFFIYEIEDNVVIIINFIHAKRKRNGK